MADTIDTTATAQSAASQQRRWWILAVLCVAQMMVVLDSTVVNIALPSAQNALHFNNNDRQWIITAYSLTFGSLLLLGGKLSDLFGRKRTLIIGLCGFALASAVGGAAQSFLMFAGARAVQGAFGALLAPSVLSLVTTTFTKPDDRNKAFGIYGGVLASGASIGLLLGGALTEYIDWRAVMYVNVVLAVIAVSAAFALLVNQRSDEQPHIDMAGVLTVTGGLFAVVFGFSHAETTSWSNVWTIGLIAAGVALLALFVGIEAHVPHPLLPLRILKDRNRSAAYLTIGIAAVAMFGTFLFVTFYLQGIKGYSPIQTGLAFLPLTLVLMATSIVGSTLLRPRVGPRWLVTIGMSLGALGMLYLTRLGVNSSYETYILPTLLAEGIGLGLVFSTATNNATLGVQPSDSGVASATVNASQQIGGSMGTALLSTVAASATTGYLAGINATPSVIAQASVHGYTVAFGWSAAIFAVGAIVAAGMFKRRAPRAEPASSVDWQLSQARPDTQRAD